MSEPVALFATPEMGRIFIACDRCHRVMPHYRVYGRKVTKASDGMCACGSTMFKPRRLSEIHAAWWVLVVGWLWRHKIRKQEEWDPRMPIRTEHLNLVLPS